MTGTNYFEYLSQVHEIDERCEIHGTRLKVFKDFEPFCLACREERIRKKNKRDSNKLLTGRSDGLHKRFF